MAGKQKLTEQDFRLARKIRKLRKDKGISQTELARKVGVSTTYIGYLEIGYRKPNIKMLSKIARALNIQVRDLIPF